MEFQTTALEGVLEINLSPYTDSRGSFTRIFDYQMFVGSAVPALWVQENQSINVSRGIVRGLHFLLPPHTDGKLIRCARGAIFDVVVDLRASSKTRGKWISFHLEEKDNRLLYIPKGFAHGFCSLSEYSEVIYKHDAYYVKEADSGIKWDDPDLAIEWPIKNPIISEKDKNLLSYQKFIEKFKSL